MSHLTWLRGDIFDFIGPNGAGKSTTIRLLLSLIYPTSGSATIFGKDCIKYGPELRQEIGYLPSEVFYYERMKVIDLLKCLASFCSKDCTQRMHELASQTSSVPCAFHQGITLAGHGIRNLKPIPHTPYRAQHARLAGILLNL
jgi:ABC-type uncharacterized transport system ATPase subunit